MESIKIKVLSSTGETTYLIQQDKFEQINEILKDCETIDTLSNEDKMMSVMKSLCDYNNNKKVVYDLSEKPHDMTIDEVLARYRDTNILLTDSGGKKDLNTKFY